MDDEEAIRVFLCRVLGSSGYAVESATDGQQALEKMERNRPDLLLLDLMMPVMDGWQVLTRLRGRAGSPPVLVISAYLDRDRAIAEGAAETLAKPFGLGQLLDACTRVLARA